jgi:tetratricopeptide (TPR) repeat protein
MPLIKAKLLYEMALCCENQHNPQMAFQYLAKCLTASQDNSIFPAATLKLAQINFQLEQYEKAKKLCDNIILMQCPSEIKHETADLIAKIYLKQKNFDKAAMALIENSEI